MGKANQSISKNEKILLIGLNKFGEIIQFNKECQKITKYSRNDVIYKKILDFLIPNSYVSQWNKMFESAIKNRKIDNFEIPLKTSDGKEILIALSSLNMDNEKSSDGQISFIGNIVDTNYSDEKSLEIPNININNEPEKRHNLIEYKEERKIDDIILSDTKDEKIIKNSSDIDEKVTFSEDEKSRETPNFFKAIKNLTNKNKTNENPLLNFENESNIETNEEKNIAQNQNIFFEEVVESGLDNKNIKIDNFSHKEENKKRKHHKKTNVPEDIESLIHSIDVREEELNKFESRLIEDRKILDKRIVELSNWKEKLLELESEIEKRRQDLVEQESAFLQNLISVADNKNKLIEHTASKKNKIISNNESSENNLYDIFEKIQDSAVIIQRGNLKKANQSFAELLGYDLDELVDKRLFDFITPEAYPEIEKYYLDRLKGIKSSRYNIILLTKDNNELSVNVSTRPTNFNGDKAEIIIFNKTSSSENDISSNEPTKEENHKVTDTKHDVSDETSKDIENEKIEDKKEEKTIENEEENNNKIEEKTNEDNNSTQIDRKEQSNDTVLDSSTDENTNVDET